TRMSLKPIASSLRQLQAHRFRTHHRPPALDCLDVGQERRRATGLRQRKAAMSTPADAPTRRALRRSPYGSPVRIIPNIAPKAAARVRDGRGASCRTAAPLFFGRDRPTHRHSAPTGRECPMLKTILVAATGNEADAATFAAALAIARRFAAH